jgi:hypothetical protein
VHARRGVDAVPVCFAVEGLHVAVPIDRIKPKGSVELQRVRNLERDGRASLLCDHWDREDWSRLWWVRASLQLVDVEPAEKSVLEEDLRAKYVPYRRTEFASLLVFRIEELIGWTAAAEPEATTDP